MGSEVSMVDTIKEEEEDGQFSSSSKDSMNSISSVSQSSSFNLGKQKSNGSGKNINKKLTARMPYGKTTFNKQKNEETLDGLSIDLGLPSSRSSKNDSLMSDKSDNSAVSVKSESAQFKK